MDLGIAGKTALVTASSRGLGFASAAALAAEGCRVAICGRDEARLAEAAESLGPATLAIPADVADPAVPDDLVARTVERFGGLDILVANAGGGRIVLITSSAVKQPIPDLTASNTARAGLWAWAKTAAADLAPEGITLNLVCPGYHATDRIRELGVTAPTGDPADFGRIVAFLCSAHAGFISGAALQVDGAATLGLL
jgi:3-oxoacyl-[acyl-carrier protein] reductase